MAAYLIVDIEVMDAALYEAYRREVPASIAKYGGRFLVRGGAFEVLEGGWQPKRVIVLEFPAMDALKRWYHSADYKPLIDRRQKAARANIIAVEGA